MLTKSVFCKLVQQGELLCLHITHPKFFAEICLQGAQLTQFTPTHKPKSIWLSPTAEYNKGQGLRGGIPICWPWFGSLAKNPKSIQQQVSDQSYDYENLAHGFVRTRDWSLSHYSESAHEVRLSLKIQHSEETLKIWPFKFHLECHFTLTDHLEIRLETSNLSDTPMHYSQALHTYFPTEDIHQTRILGAEKQPYVDALDNWEVKQQNQPISIKEEVDRLYFGNADYRIQTPSNMITVESNSKSSVIWNPWVNKSKRLSQFTHNDYESMLCIESANVLEDSITLLPNTTHTLSLSVHSTD